ncbi:glutathione S-transferase family protein [Faunimonas sp. B44]|uniref:glutathione S-transferase family protein n=1 Tax=Faunimonas sp. B44 TaxID=3461493 RepID=UPI004044EFE3
MLTLYSQQDSGNCYKPRLLLAHLGRPFRLIDVDANSGVTRSDDFLSLNPIGKVPVLEFPDGRRLAESGAILLHLAEGTAFLPGDAYARAKAYEWMFFEQYSHEPTIAVRRSLLIYPERADEATPERLAALFESGTRALEVMEKRLRDADWLAGEAFSVADIALYAYTHCAGEGGFDLGAYPGIGAWLDRIDALSGHVTMDWRPPE